MHSLCSYLSFHFIKSIAGDGEYVVFRLFNDCSRRHVKVLIYISFERFLERDGDKSGLRRRIRLAAVYQD